MQNDPSKASTEFSFVVTKTQTSGELSGRDVLEAATDVMREIPAFQHRRKDGGLYKQSRKVLWSYVGSSETAIVGACTNWVVIITAIGGGKFTARVLPSNLCCCPLQSFRELEKQAA